jgi:thymidine phosphorylase
LHDVTMALCAELLVQSGLFAEEAAALQALIRVLDDGRAGEVFERMVAALGGPSDLLARPDRHLAVAPLIVAVPSLRDGFVTEIDTRSLGMAVVALGGGRRRAADAIDFAVGLSAIAALGTDVGSGSPLAMVHARTRAAADAAVSAVQEAMRVGAEAPAPGPALYQRVRG